MSTIRELAESAHLIATARPTNNAGIDVIEDAIQAAVNDHTRALADALEDSVLGLESVIRNMDVLNEALRKAGLPSNFLVGLEPKLQRARAALRLAGRLSAEVPCVCDNGVFRDCPVHYPEG